jgi:hypothetical protein
MSELLISCFIMVVCAMGAWVAFSGDATRSQILSRDHKPLSNDSD